MVSEIGRNPIYELDIDGRPLTLVHPGVGAPLAAAFLEEMIARGCRAFVACGGAGVLVPDVALGHVIVPSVGVRDEGTSYHYLPAAREVEPTRQAFDAIVATLERHHVPHVTGKTWTTDGLYRETRGKVASDASPRDASRWRWKRRRSSRWRRSAESRSDSCSTRATICRATRGTSADGTRTPAGASCCSGSQPRRAWSSPPDSPAAAFGILRA